MESGKSTTSPSAVRSLSTRRCTSPDPSFATVTSGAFVERAALFCLHTSPLAALGGPNAGGMNLHVLKLADGLSELGIQTDVFTRRESAQAPEVIQRDSGARIVHVAGGPARDVGKRLLPLHIPAMVK